jgi:hypothetical protein
LIDWFEHDSLMRNMSTTAAFRDPQDRADLPQFSADSHWRRNFGDP